MLTYLAQLASFCITASRTITWPTGACGSDFIPTIPSICPRHEGSRLNCLRACVESGSSARTPLPATTEWSPRWSLRSSSWRIGPANLFVRRRHPRRVAYSTERTEAPQTPALCALATDGSPGRTEQPPTDVGTGYDSMISVLPSPATSDRICG